MLGNICSSCLAKVHSLENMRNASEWGVCEVCNDTGVFYARKDEISIAKSLFLTEQIEILRGNND